METTQLGVYQMPGLARWACEQHIIYSKLWDDVTLETVATCFNTFIRMIDSSPSLTVHAILDVLEMKKYPKNIRHIQQVTKNYFLHPRRGYSVHVTEDIYQYFTGSIISGVFDAKYKLVASTEEAIHFILASDSNLEVGFEPLKLLAEPSQNTFIFI